ncbi:tetratricopeptide repeat protein [Actinoplanes sp. NPDC023936]|uniref:tetratricopeptide repeat protein n=1 Tax=Actinoplanes sp. NPDC023936 TaxID=3154910 RepID=UPI003401963A
MAEGASAARRGRREEAIDANLPAHRVAFATRLRDLRRECGQPSYRVLSRLGHCGFGSLSEAAGGRRLPSWQTTRGYVTGCLRHAGRDAEIDRVLPEWRRTWEAAATVDQVGPAAPPSAPAPPPQPVPTPVTAPGPPPVTLRGPPPVTLPEPSPGTAPEPPPVIRRRRPLPRLVAVLTAAAALLATVAAAEARAPAPMAGLYNILVVPFESAPAVQRTLVHNLEAWAAEDAAIETRGPAGVRPAEPARLAAEHRADVVLSGRLRTAGDRTTLVIELLLTDRVFGETPEFVGRHELRLTEPADVVRGNIEVSRRLADDALHYVKAVVAFVRGLGRYALDDYPGAEREFRAADHELARVDTSSEVVQLMLGNTIGRDSRFAEAETAFRRALARRPDYARAAVGLAEALRAGSSCDKRSVHAGKLREAIVHYRTALPVAGDALLETKARLGLGLAHQCLSIAEQGDYWADADAEFTAVQRVHASAGLTEEAGRQSSRLAAEARAGQALSAHLTAGGNAARLADAATAYQEAITLLGRIGVDRPTIRERELIFLRNLREVYRAMEARAEFEAVDARIRDAGG